jgi:hypothetical protein
MKMKRISKLFLLLLFITTAQIYAQYTFSVSPPTCSSCCNGTIIVIATICPQGVALGGITPSLALLSVTFNTLVYAGACCETYTMSSFSAGEGCPPGIYIGTVSVNCLGVGIDDINEGPTISHIFPNPASKHCFTGIPGLKTIFISDPTSSVILRGVSITNEIDLEGLKPGIYFVEIYENEMKKVHRQKLIVD